MFVYFAISFQRFSFIFIFLHILSFELYLAESLQEYFSLEDSSNGFTFYFSRAWGILQSEINFLGLLLLSFTLNTWLHVMMIIFVSICWFGRFKETLKFKWLLWIVFMIGLMSFWLYSRRFLGISGWRYSFDHVRTEILFFYSFRTFDS